jgi:hypothetical protein
MGTYPGSRFYICCVMNENIPFEGVLILWRLKFVRELSQSRLFRSIVIEVLLVALDDLVGVLDLVPDSDFNFWLAFLQNYRLGQGLIHK